MRTKSLYLLFFSFLISCTAQNFNGKIINSHLEEEYESNTLKTYLALTKMNEKEVVEIYEVSLNNGNKTKYELDKKWPFSKDDLLMIKKQFSNKNTDKWNSKVIKSSSNFEIVDESNIDIARSISDKTARLFYVSDYFLNKDGTKALQGIMVLSGLNISETYVLVYIKEDNNWIQTNKIYSTELN